MNPDDAQIDVIDVGAGAPTSITRDTTFVKPDDPSQYIRTYAKDVAMLTKTPAPVSAPAPASQATSQTYTDGVSLPTVDESPINSRESVSPNEYKQEVVEVTKADSDGIFTSRTTPVAAPAPATSLMPQPPVPSPTEDREAILARLRGNTAAVPVTEPTLSADTQHVPHLVNLINPEVKPSVAGVDTYRESIAPIEIAPDTSASLRTSAPIFTNTDTSPVPPIVPLTPPTPAFTPRPIVAQPADVAPSPIHTFTTDFADRVDREKASTFSVLAAQGDSGQRTTTTIKPPSRNIWLPLAGGALIILAGIGIAAGAYSYTHRAIVAPTVHGVPSIVTFDESKEVSGAGAALAQAINDVAGGANVPNNVVVTYTSLNSVPQEGGAVINALSLGAPDILLRNIDPASTVGVVSNASGQAYPFFALKVNSYERTFAGMLAWEPSMAQDLAAFYPATSVSIVPAPNSTASSTPISVAVPASNVFTDDVVDNHDVRVLRDGLGQSIMLYGYNNKDTLIIARDEAAFTLIVNRLTASSQ